MADALALTRPRPLVRRPRLRVNTVALIGGVLSLLVVLAAVLAPWISPYDPFETNPLDRFQTPSATHWFGTDDIGRDIFSRVLHGAQISIVAAATVLAIALSIGVTLGAIAGYGGRWVDNLTASRSLCNDIPPALSPSPGRIFRIAASPCRRLLRAWADGRSGQNSVQSSARVSPFAPANARHASISRI